jgi:hypothetical protein
MLARRSCFLDVGGFSEKVRKWGGTDVGISLKTWKGKGGKEKGSERGQVSFLRRFRTVVFGDAQNPPRLPCE